MAGRKPASSVAGNRAPLRDRAAEGGGGVHDLDIERIERRCPARVVHEHDDPVDVEPGPG